MTLSQMNRRLLDGFCGPNSSDVDEHGQNRLDDKNDDNNDQTNGSGEEISATLIVNKVALKGAQVKSSED
jgi:hypothetical protein